MSKPKSLASIVRAKELREEQLQAELARLEHAVGAARQRLEDGLCAIQRHDEDERARRGRSPWLGLAREYRRRLEREIYEASLALEAKREGARSARERAVAASKERRTAEQLLERHVLAAQTAIRQADNARMDEIAQRLGARGEAS
jgi:flagellar export protein FliJ